jgi:sedoheptulokinase
MAALGIDLGTTSVKVCIVNLQSKKVLQSISKNTEADVKSNCHLGHEQDVSKILQCLHECMLELSREYLMKVTSIGVCGQMHGCVLWRSKCYEEGSSHPCPTIHIQADNLHLSSSAVVSNLHTWQDGRCDKDFLASLPTPSSSVPISTGYGNATIAWLNSHHPKELTKYDSAGTIMDLVACGLTGNTKPKMAAQNAVSWGYFNTQSHTWDLNILKSIAFPTHLLPEVTMPGGVCGVLHSPWHGIPDGVRVSASLGDLQCSVLSSVDGRSRNGAGGCG